MCKRLFAKGQRVIPRIIDVFHLFTLLGGRCEPENVNMVRVQGPLSFVK